MLELNSIPFNGLEVAYTIFFVHINVPMYGWEQIYDPHYTSIVEVKKI